MKTIDRKGIARFLDGLSADHAVYAPVLRGGNVVFDRISSGSEALLDFSNSKVPPKRVVMPQMQTLLSSSGEGQDAAEHTGVPRPIVLFGARPCDARALVFLDRVFGRRIADPYYTALREAMTVISLGCAEPRPTCFCETTGGGPLSPEGSDILLEPSREGWVVRAVSGEGRALAEDFGLPVEPVDENPAEAWTGACRPAIEPQVDLALLKKNLDRSFDDPRWRTLTEKCLGCGACSFLCPACHCFDIVDGEDGGVRSRSRIWDSCQFPSFTSQASGFNPRPSGVERFRQRMMHKFSYCVENYGTPGCVGCGRCVADCPVNLDIRLLMRAFHEGGGS